MFGMYLSYRFTYKKMPCLRGRARNIGRRIHKKQTVQNRRLNRTVEEHLIDNINVRKEIANSHVRIKFSAKQSTSSC